jgi:hypothetical protein
MDGDYSRSEHIHIHRYHATIVVNTKKLGIYVCKCALVHACIVHMKNDYEKQAR